MPRDNNLCPECSGPMVSRLNSKTQQRFWGCKDFPKCRGTRDTDGRSQADRDREFDRAANADWRDDDRN